MRENTGKIYKLYNKKLDLSYIGKTEQSLEERLHQHRIQKQTSYNTSKELFTDGEVIIELLHEIDINNYDDKVILTNLEKDYILKTKCVNRCLPFTASVPYTDDRAEYMRQYARYNYRKNKEKILSYQKEYRIKNIEKVKAYQKRYRQENKLKKFIK